MNKEIKEILDKMIETSHPNGVFLNAKTRDKIIDYITNLQEENERLKKQLNCKERLTKILPEDTEFIILSKSDYDRQEKDIELILNKFNESNSNGGK